MTKKFLNTLCRLYDYIYTDKPFKSKTVAFLICRGKIVSIGINSDKTSPMQKLYRVKTELGNIENFIDKEHAEINCLRKLDCEINMKKCAIVVISKRFDGTFRMSKPCDTCMTAIRDYEVKKIYYRDRNQEFVCERVF